MGQFYFGVSGPRWVKIQSALTDKHRGAALAFEIHPDLITEILYTTRRKTLNVPALTKRGDLAKKDKAIIYATKSQHWEYEEEVRVFVLLKDCIQDGGLYFAPFSRLFRPVGLIAGPLCKVTEAQIAQALPKGESVHLTRSRLAFRSFNVVKNKSFTPVVIHGVGPI